MIEAVWELTVISPASARSAPVVSATRIATPTASSGTSAIRGER